MSTKSELKENILADKLETVVKWGMENRPKVLGGLVFLVMAGLISSVFIIRSQETNEVNWTRLTQAQTLMSQSRNPQSREILTDIRSHSPNTPAFLYATFYLGELNLTEKKYDEATANFSEVVAQTGKQEPLRPLALSNLGHAQEQKKDFQAAAKTYQQFTEEYPDHFMAPRVQLELGRNLSLSGEKEAAKKILGQLMDLYPTSPWAENARRIMDKIETR